MNEQGMNIKRRAVGNFILWLFLGLAAGVFLAAVLSYHEYRTVAGLVDSVLETEENRRDSDKDMPLSDDLARCLKKNTDRNPKETIQEG